MGIDTNSDEIIEDFNDMEISDKKSKSEKIEDASEAIQKRANDKKILTRPQKR